jgi:hypothetical protein
VAVLPVDDNDGSGSKGEASEQRLTVVHIRQATKLVKGDQVFQSSIYINFIAFMTTYRPYFLLQIHYSHVPVQLMLAARLIPSRKVARSGI